MLLNNIVGVRKTTAKSMYMHQTCFTNKFRSTKIFNKKR